MRRILAFALILYATSGAIPFATLAQPGPVTEREALARELRNAWLPLESGMAVSRSEGTPISAKYEIDNGVRDYARDVLRLSYAISAILPQNARSRRVAERSGARAAGQMEVVGLTWDRYEWPLATGGAAQPQPASTK